MPLQANAQRKRRGMKANEDRQKRKTRMFIASGVFCLLLWISSWYCIYYFFSSLNNYSGGSPPPWYQPLIFAVKYLPVPSPLSIIAEIGFILIFIGLFRLVRSLLHHWRGR
jgi:hypothetical protein